MCVMLWAKCNFQ
eukprot:Gb_41663 [translate_table: standard]